MSPAKPRYSINDVADEDSPHVFIRNLAPKIHGTVTHILVPFTSSQTGDQKSIEIPMTMIPYDLASWTPKEELIRNPELRRLWSDGVIDFIPAEEAIEELKSPEAIEEADRLFTQRQLRTRSRSREVTGAPSRVDQEQLNQQLQQLPPSAPGDYDASTIGVNGAVVAAMVDADMSDSHRLSLLRNLLPIMTDSDKRYVRGITENANIRKLVS